MCSRLLKLSLNKNSGECRTCFVMTHNRATMRFHDLEFFSSLWFHDY